MHCASGCFLSPVPEDRLPAAGVLCSARPDVAPGPCELATSRAVHSVDAGENKSHRTVRYTADAGVSGRVVQSPVDRLSHSRHGSIRGGPGPGARRKNTALPRRKEVAARPATTKRKSLPWRNQAPASSCRAQERSDRKSNAANAGRYSNAVRGAPPLSLIHISEPTRRH